MLSQRDLTTERGRLVLTGADRIRFLHSMVTHDIEGLAPGQGCRAVMLTVKGRTIGELAVSVEEERVFLETEGALGATIRDILDKHVVMDDVEVTDVSATTRELGVWGDDARAALARALGTGLPELAPYHVARVAGLLVIGAADLGVPGLHVVAEEGAALPAIEGAQPLDEATAEILRIEAGRPRWGVELDEERLVLEANLDDAISLKKGCYLGQEVVARATARGHVNRRLKGLLLDGEGAAPRGSVVSIPDRDDAGQVTSSAVSPRLGPIALAYVHRTAFTDGNTVTVRHPDGHTRSATVVPLPFPARR